MIASSYYDLGKAAQLGPGVDVDWDRPGRGQRQPGMMNLHDYRPYLAMDEKPGDEFWMHMNSWSLSRFLHGEQGALLWPRSCAPGSPPERAKRGRFTKPFDGARPARVPINTCRSQIRMMYRSAPT